MLDGKSLDQLAKDANVALANEPGFMHTFAYRVSPPTLAHVFDHHLSAASFQASRSLISPKYRTDPENPKVVLQDC
jgi:hypothetical protein